MASSVDEKVASFDSVFDEALKCLEKASSINGSYAHGLSFGVRKININ